MRPRRRLLARFAEGYQTANGNQLVDIDSAPPVSLRFNLPPNAVS
jgi:hypothetical protein